MSVGKLVCVMVALALALASPASADDVPWAANVSDAQMKEAERLLGEGNTLFVDKRYADALDRYTKAIASWDHPAIRFNMVRCLIALGRNFEAFDNITLALRYGEAPLEKGIYEEALNYKKLLERQVAEVSVKCTQPGVKVTLDGQPLLVCPGARNRRVEAGTHQVVGTKRDFLTSTNDLVITGGTTKQLTIDLVMASPTARWAPWKPWVVVIAGVTTAGIGTLFRLKANSESELFKRDIDAICVNIGCNETGENGQPRTPRDHERKAAVYNGLAVGSWMLGAATAATGGVLVYLNRIRLADSRRVTMLPVNGGATVTVGGRF